MDRAPRPGSSRAERLDPTWADRLSRLTRPGPARVTAVRRVLAAALALTAVVLLLRGDPADDRVAVVAAAHDLTPGLILGADDVRLVELVAATVPVGALRTLDDAVGHTLTGPARAGETLTDVRMLGPRLANAATNSSDARVVPIRLADPEVTDLLREGDRVDVLTVDADTDGPAPAARVLASAATVILVSPNDSGHGARERVVMLALPSDQATTVAAASLSTALTVTFH
ncbi:SAF domain-containing protein [Rhodococcus sp. NPDC058514]|uniref:SAF domain-containing protein n=1 Tax=unclassified Rhodococcus (in: high G+C Gram-positive bacteria) TaxID=192944 RepID=UPI003656AB03